MITPDVYDELGLLADTLHDETVRCLLGATRGDSVVVDVAWRPRRDRSTPTSVHYQPCPVATIALWHNHPLIEHLPPEQACYLSRIDIKAAVRPDAPPVQIVQVASGVMCGGVNDRYVRTWANW